MRCRRGRAPVGVTCPSAPSCTRISGATSCAPSSRKPWSSEHPRHAGQQMIVATVEMADRARQHAQRCQIEIDQLTETRPHQRADEDHVAATFAPRQPQEPAELRHVRPSDADNSSHARDRPSRAGRTAPLRGRSSTKASATVNGKVPPPQMMATGPASAGRCRRGHDSPAGLLSPAWPVLPAFISGREPPALMNAMTFATTGSSAKPRSTASTRSLKWPRTRNNAR